MPVNRRQRRRYSKALDLQQLDKKWQQFDGYGANSKDGKLSLKELQASKKSWEQSSLPGAEQQVALIEQMIARVESEGTEAKNKTERKQNPFSPQATFLDFREADVYASPTHKLFAEHTTESTSKPAEFVPAQEPVSVLRLQLEDTFPQESHDTDVELLGELLAKELTQGELDSISSKIDVLKASGQVADVETVFLQSVYGYTTDDYKQINDALRSNDPDKMAAQKTYIEGIDKGLDAMPVYQGVVWRGTNLPEDVLSQYEPGQVIQEKAYVSTTQEKSMTSRFRGNVLFVIQTKEGESNGREIDKLSYMTKEKEVLFERDTQFEVLAKDADPANPLQYVIYLQEV